MVWAYDFVFDTTSAGQQIKCLTVVDEYTRECLADASLGSQAQQASYRRCSGCPSHGQTLSRYVEGFHTSQEIIMGKYVLGWILGIPAIVLVVAYFFFH